MSIFSSNSSSLICQWSTSSGSQCSMTSAAQGFRQQVQPERTLKIN